MITLGYVDQISAASKFDSHIDFEWWPFPSSRSIQYIRAIQARSWSWPGPGYWTAAVRARSPRFQTSQFVCSAQFVDFCIVTKWLEIPYDRLPQLNKSSTHVAGYSWHHTDDGRGDAIEAVSELWHQLHCLVCQPTLLL